ncbi:MAG: sugar transferase [Chloroflexi bacterium]|nr:sugar transferase [Chloroflexota bacterium]
MAKRREWQLFIAGLVAADSVAVLAALNSAYYLRLTGDFLPYEPTPPFAFYATLSAWMVPVWLLLFAVNGLYSRRYLLGGPQEYGRIVNASTYGLVIAIGFDFMSRSFVSRGWTLLAWVLAILFSSGLRFLARRVVYRLRRQGRFISRAIIVGANDQGVAIAEQLSPVTHYGVHVLGFADDYLPLGTPVVGDLRVLGSAASAESLAQRDGADELIVVPNAIAWETLQTLVQRTTAAVGQREVKLSPGLYDVLVTGVRLNEIGHIPLFSLQKVRITGADALLKAAFDMALVVGAAFVVWPFFLLALAVARLTGRGPVLVRTAIVGRGGVQVNTYRFAELRCRGRVPRWLRWFAGSYLRIPMVRSLPLLWNVFRREMSFVGPRPIPLAELADYERWLPNLLTVRPGVCGPWRLGDGAQQSPRAIAQLDLAYLRNYTFWQDFQVLFQNVLFSGVFHGPSFTRAPRRRDRVEPVAGGLRRPDAASAGAGAAHADCSSVADAAADAHARAAGDAAGCPGLAGAVHPGERQPDPGQADSRQLADCRDARRAARQAG